MSNPSAGLLAFSWENSGPGQMTVVLSIAARQKFFKVGSSRGVSNEWRFVDRCAINHGPSGATIATRPASPA
jgi:hypothetical protein